MKDKHPARRPSKAVAPSIPYSETLFLKWAVPFLALAVFFLFLPYLNPWGSRVLSLPSQDLAGQFLWWRQFGFEELKKGHLALWDPHLFCGAPFFGGFQSALLYPPNWLFMVLPLPFAANLSIALHIFLSGWFTYLWVKGRGSNPLSALLAAFAFMFGSATFLHIVPGHLPNLCSIAWIPLVFRAVDGWREERKERFIYLGMMTLALQIFSGHVQYVYYTAMAVAAYVLFSLPWISQKTRFLAGLIGMGLGAGFLAAIQLLSGWEAAAESIRGQPFSLDFLNMANLNPERLCLLFLPDFFGGWDHYWGGGVYWEGPVFISVTAFLLALFALRASEHPQKKILGLLVLFFFLLSFGKVSPLFVLFCKFCPLFDHFRGVGKLNVIITLFLAALSALGMDVALKKPERLEMFCRAAGWGGGALILASIAFFLAPRVGGSWLFKEFLPHAGGMAESLLRGGLTFLGLSLLAFGAGRQTYLRWGLALAAMVELAFFTQSNLPSFDFHAAQKKASAIQHVYDQDPGDYRVCVERWNYTLGTSGFDVWGEDPLIPLRYALFAARATGHDSDHILDSLFPGHPKAFGLVRLRYLFADQGGTLIPRRCGLREAPRAFLAGRWETMEWDDILKKVTRDDFDPLEELLLESDPGIPQTGGAVKGEVAVKDVNSDEVQIDARLDKPALLVMTDNYSKDWKVRPSGSPGQPAYRVMPAYGFLRAVPLTAGEHHLLMEYRPALFDAGKWISILSWVCFFCLLTLKRRDL